MRATFVTVLLGMTAMDAGLLAQTPTSRPSTRPARSAKSAETPARPRTAKGVKARRRAKPSTRRTTIRGITVSTHGVGREWADAERMLPTFERIRASGATWVALHPYARIYADGRVDASRYSRPRRGRAGQAKPAAPAHWTAPIEYARKAGLKILVKPHLAYWGSPFRWRGDIRFDDEETWRRFFESYGTWIEDVARACRKADAFVVGTELDATLAHAKRWSAIIRRVRKVTPTPLTYAANWSDFERVPFWKQLDAVGIQAYFPLSTAEQPKLADLRKAWATRMRELSRFAQRHGKDIVFTELGYNTSFKAAREPWDYKSDGLPAAPLQHACMRAALEAIESEPRVIGSFLWKWFPDPNPVGRDFPIATDGMLRVLRGVWSSTLPKAKNK